MTFIVTVCKASLTKREVLKLTKLFDLASN